MKSLIIHIDCSDQIGIIFSFTKVLKEFSANILAMVEPARPAPTINILSFSKLYIMYNIKNILIITDGQMSYHC